MNILHVLTGSKKDPKEIAWWITKWNLISILGILTLDFLTWKLLIDGKVFILPIQITAICLVIGLIYWPIIGIVLASARGALTGENNLFDPKAALHAVYYVPLAIGGLSIGIDALILSGLIQSEKTLWIAMVLISYWAIHVVLGWNFGRWGNGLAALATVFCIIIGLALSFYDSGGFDQVSRKLLGHVPEINTERTDAFIDLDKEINEISDARLAKDAQAVLKKLQARCNDGGNDCHIDIATIAKDVLGEERALIFLAHYEQDSLRVGRAGSFARTIQSNLDGINSRSPSLLFWMVIGSLAIIGLSLLFTKKGGVVSTLIGAAIVGAVVLMLSQNDLLRILSKKFPPPQQWTYVSSIRYSPAEDAGPSGQFYTAPTEGQYRITFVDGCWMHQFMNNEGRGASRPMVYEVCAKGQDGTRYIVRQADLRISEAGCRYPTFMDTSETFEGMPFVWVYNAQRHIRYAVKTDIRNGIAVVDLKAGDNIQLDVNVIHCPSVYTRLAGTKMDTQLHAEIHQRVF